MNEDKKTCCGGEENDGCGCGSNNQENEGCGCGGHDHEHDEHDGCGCGEALTVDLEDENGNVVPCEIVDGFTYKDNEYALVQNPEDDSIYLFKVIGDEETGELIIPEDEEFAEVTKYYEEMIKEEK
ncbi:DUF1292 domain-containing protein [Clostridium sp. CF012]|uniref:DUF1292 domain-containing protein n=1 Tax=Clostridium sp. CF012 TaxID=2843319 RepID=UPI001C0C3D11|nr:DUF1292 domain-containing protein [Clostridium sp. CF012]MBU3142366.1 DUF1292 domain-containing protein [Clostridium sp. CF012]